MSSDLVQSILIPEVFVLSETCIVPLCVEFVCLFCCEVLAPTSRVVPMMLLQHVPHCLVNNHSVLDGVRLGDERPVIATFIAGLESTHSEVCLSHLLLLSTYIEYALALWAILVPFLRC